MHAALKWHTQDLKIQYQICPSPDSEEKGTVPDPMTSRVSHSESKVNGQRSVCGHWAGDGGHRAWRQRALGCMPALGRWCLRRRWKKPWVCERSDCGEPQQGPLFILPQQRDRESEWDSKRETQTLGNNNHCCNQWQSTSQCLSLRYIRPDVHMIWDMYMKSNIIGT